ncbi:hypothetical protein BU23DRAFT_290461 [Bimuria novae-zelandiae CBS 107.79]|uniref:Uncharacterized protein n=1 Tax=Bimuria novae-zelandiae CBS 107.79 TaxID=1447943 RepID=A0A6A5UQG1_9PLEO|nr:hypothetical protein BU23DRAFT_290461 [Bimuria novae-zelandiae CBS 107.79]
MRRCRGPIDLHVLSDLCKSASKLWVKSHPAPGPTRRALLGTTVDRNFAFEHDLLTDENDLRRRTTLPMAQPCTPDTESLFNSHCLPPEKQQHYHVLCASNALQVSFACTRFLGVTLHGTLYS